MRRHSLTRSIGYLWSLAPERRDEFDEDRVERILRKAQQRGVIHQFDTGRGRCCWFNGPPGRELRAVRDEVDALMPRGMERRR